MYTTPAQHISDVITTTNIIDKRGRIFYQIVTNGENDGYVSINMRDKENEIVANVTSSDMKGYIEIENVKPWWPYLMHPEPGYLYTLEVSTFRIQLTCYQ